MKDKEFKYWSKTRKKGKYYFIIVNGAIIYGLSMFIAMSFFILKPFENGFTFNNVASHVIIWLIAGLTFGLVMWLYSEHRYKKALESRNSA